MAKEKPNKLRQWARSTLLAFGLTIGGAGAGTGTYIIYDIPNEVMQLAEVAPDVAEKQLELAQEQAERQMMFGGALIAAAAGISLVGRRKDDDGEGGEVQNDQNTTSVTRNAKNNNANRLIDAILFSVLVIVGAALIGIIGLGNVDWFYPTLTYAFAIWIAWTRFSARPHNRIKETQ